MNALRFPGPPPVPVETDATATRAQRAREASAAHACRWCGRELAAKAKRTTCSHACRSALARFFRAERNGQPIPTYRGAPMRPAALVPQRSPST